MTDILNELHVLIYWPSILCVLTRSVLFQGTILTYICYCKNLWCIYTFPRACGINQGSWNLDVNTLVYFRRYVLTHCGRVTHICVGKLTIIGSDNGLSPGRRQAIIWTNAGILLIRPLRTNFSEILSEIHSFSFKKMHLKMSSGKWRPSCLGLNVLSHCGLTMSYGII